MAGQALQHSHPDVVAPPPLLFLGPLLAGLLLDRLIPAPRPPRALRFLGLPVLAAGVGLAGWFASTMIRAGTPMDPYESPTALVTDGPFELSRNPGYLGFSLIYSGIALLTRAGWPWLLLPGVVALMNHGVIEREEAFLEDRFGRPYLDYKARVRRWL